MKNKGWPVKMLADVCEVFADGDWIESKDQSLNGVRLIQTGNIGEGIFKARGEKARYVSEATFKRLRCTEIFKGDCLISRLPEPVGRSCILPNTGERMITAVDCTIVRFDKKQFLPEFFNFYSQSQDYLKAVEAETTGTTRKRISRSKLGQVTVPVPSIPEQQRIIDILDEAFDGIATAKANAEKNLENALALFESHLQATFAQRGDGWEEKTVSELVDEGILGKPFDGNHGEIHPKRTDYVKSGVPFIMASDLQNGEVDTRHCKFLSRKLSDSLRVGFAKDGDVLLSHKATIGRSAILSTGFDYVMLTPQVTAYRIKDKTQLLNRFIHYYFMSPEFQREIIKIAEGGSTRSYIGITRQLSLKFRFPPLEVQKRLTTKFDSLITETQRLESIYKQKLDALEELKKSLLHKAFTGEL